MSYVPVVENPRRRRSKKRRHYTAKQIAAGFGGKRHRKSSRRHRRSTTLAVMNPRRRRSYRASYRRTSRRRRYHNPGFLGGFGIPGIDLKSAMWIGAGMLSTRVVPNLVAKMWPGIPRTGYMGYAVDAGSGILAGMAVKMLTKDSAAANKVVAGALGLVLFNLFNAEIAPRVGLSGMTGELASYGDLRGLGYNGGGSRVVLSHPVQTGY